MRTSKPRVRCPATLLAGLALVLAPLTAPLAEELYRWTDDDGNVHYSDTLPADKAPDARDIYDRAGQHLERVDAALSEEERELQRERERQEREAEELQRREAAEQAEYDRMLRRTFTSAEAIQEAQAERINNLRSSIQLARSRIARHDEELERLREEAAQQERISGGNPGPVHERIEEIQARVDRQEAFIQRRQADKDEIRRTFDNHIQRFRELQAEDD